MSCHIIDAQSYNQGKIGAIIEIEINCKESELTDVVKSDMFTFTKEILFHIAATSPKYTRDEDIPSEIVRNIGNDISEHLRDNYFTSNNRTEKAESHIQRQISKGVEHLLSDFYKEACLYSQPWIKDKSKSIQDLLNEKSVSIGFPIEIVKFERFDLRHNGNSTYLKLGITIE